MLKTLFISEVRIKMLRELLHNPTEQYHVRGLVRAVDTEINAVRRELKRLTKIGLVKKRQSGNRLYYTANTASIYYPELVSLLAKEGGIASDILDSQKELGRIKYAMLSRAFLRGRKPTPLDVDLFIVGTVNTELLKELVKKEEEKTGKEINYSVMSPEDFLYLKRKNDNFITRVLTQSRTMVIGDEEEFASIF